jgi:hypothetical protein
MFSAPTAVRVLKQDRAQKIRQAACARCFWLVSLWTSPRRWISEGLGVPSSTTTGRPSRAGHHLMTGSTNGVEKRAQIQQPGVPM